MTKHFTINVLDVTILSTLNLLVCLFVTSPFSVADDQAGKGRKITTRKASSITDTPLFSELTVLNWCLIPNTLQYLYGARFMDSHRRPRSRYCHFSSNSCVHFFKETYQINSNTRSGQNENSVTKKGWYA